MTTFENNIRFRNNQFFESNKQTAKHTVLNHEYNKHNEHTRDILKPSLNLEYL